jgi:hypothetical protein
VAGSPDLGLLRVLRPIPAASAGDGPSRRPAGCWPGRAPTGWFPRSLPNRWTGSTPSYAPATSPRLRRSPSPWPPDRRHHPTMEFPARPSRAGARCCPAQIRPVRAGGFVLRSVQPLVPHVRLSVSLAGPGPSGSAGPSRRCQDCFPPSAASPASGCPQLHRPAATGQRRCPFTTTRFGSTSWRSRSATHSRSGPGGVKFRSTRSGAGAACGSRRVRPRSRRRWQPWRPAARISLATRLAAHLHVQTKPQLGVHARSAIGPTAAGMDVADLLEECRIGDGSGRGWPRGPGVIARACHTQHAGQTGDSVVGFLLIDQPIATHR